MIKRRAFRNQGDIGSLIVAEEKVEDKLSE